MGEALAGRGQAAEVGALGGAGYGGDGEEGGGSDAGDRVAQGVVKHVCFRARNRAAAKGGGGVLHHAPRVAGCVVGGAVGRENERVGVVPGDGAVQVASGVVAIYCLHREAGAVVGMCGSIAIRFTFSGASVCHA